MEHTRNNHHNSHREPVALLKGHRGVPSRLYFCNNCCKRTVERYGMTCTHCVKMLAEQELHREQLELRYWINRFYRKVFLDPYPYSGVRWLCMAALLVVVAIALRLLWAEIF